MPASRRPSRPSRACCRPSTARSPTGRSSSTARTSPHARRRRTRQAGPVALHGGAPHLRAPHRRGEPHLRRLLPRAHRHQGRPRRGLRPAAQARRHAGARGGLPLGRRAADARDRAGAHGQAQAAHARRAVPGAGATAGQGDLRLHQAGQRGDGPDRAASSSRTPGARSRSPTTATSWSRAGSSSRAAPHELRDNPDVKEFYLGLGESGGRKSFRDVKHYKRRKRWL